MKRLGYTLGGIASLIYGILIWLQIVHLDPSRQLRLVDFIYGHKGVAVVFIIFAVIFIYKGLFPPRPQPNGGKNPFED